MPGGAATTAGIAFDESHGGRQHTGVGVAALIAAHAEVERERRRTLDLDAVHRGGASRWLRPRWRRVVTHPSHVLGGQAWFATHDPGDPEPDRSERSLFDASDWHVESDRRVPPVTELVEPIELDVEDFREHPHHPAPEEGRNARIEDRRRRALRLSEPVRRSPARVGVRAVLGDLLHADAVNPFTDLESGHRQRVAAPPGVDPAGEERGIACRGCIGQRLDRLRVRAWWVDEVHHRARHDVGARSQDPRDLGHGLSSARFANGCVDHAVGTKRKQRVDVRGRVGRRSHHCAM